MSGSKENNLPWENRSRITTLEAEYKYLTKTVDAIDAKVDQILENHLPHIQQAVDKLGNRFWWLITLLIANLFGVIISYLK